MTIQTSSHITRFQLWLLVLIVFFDIGNFFLPMPIYAPLLLKSHWLLLAKTQRIKLLSLLTGTYSIAQLLGAPLLGILSDRIGKKPALIYSLYLATCGCLTSAFGVVAHNIPAIFLGRFALGFASGVIALVFAITTELTNDKNRPIYFGYINVGISLGIIILPILGGYLSLNGKEFAYPFFATSLCYLLILCLTHFTSLTIRTNTQAKHTQKTKQSITPFKKLINPMLLFFIFTGLLFQIGTEMFYVIAPLKLTLLLTQSIDQLSNHYFILGCFAAITSLSINKFLSKNYSSSSILWVSLTGLIICIIPLSISKPQWLINIPYIGIGLFGTLCWIHINNIFAEQASKYNIGSMMGISQSLWSLGGIISSLIITTFYNHYHQNLFIIPAISIILALLFFAIFRIAYRSTVIQGKHL
jgi:DHA1 family tetracycline resistance protein-like MFS transporter